MSFINKHSCYSRLHSTPQDVPEDLSQTAAWSDLTSDELDELFPDPGVDPEGARDLGLLFRWRLPQEIRDNRDLPWTGDRRRDHAIGCVMAEALAAAPTGMSISYSRRKGWWPGKTLLGGESFTYAHVVGAVDRLANEGWIVSTKAKPKKGGSGFQSTFIASERLTAWYGGADRRLSYRLRHPILLRGADRELMTVPKTREMERVRQRLDRINEVVGAADLRLEADDIAWTPDQPVMVDGRWCDPRRQQAHIVFNGDVRHGGRLYSLWYQTLDQRKKGRRSQLRLEGSPVVEPDFSGCHPRLLYHELGLEADGDLYDIGPSEHDRGHVKVMVQILINASSERQAVSAFAWKRARQDAQTAEDDGDRPWTPERIDAQARSYMYDARELSDALKARHAPIAGALYTGVGSRLQHAETQIMTRAGMDCLDKGVLTLPMHDSRITKAENGGILIEAMDRAYYDATGHHPTIGH